VREGKRWGGREGPYTSKEGKWGGRGVREGKER